MIARISYNESITEKHGYFYIPVENGSPPLSRVEYIKNNYVERR
jgi:hypothetical protein